MITSAYQTYQGACSFHVVSWPLSMRALQALLRLANNFAFADEDVDVHGSNGYNSGRALSTGFLAKTGLDLTIH